MVYVDSGSTDGSARLAKEIGINVVELDDRAPFTAARGRNKGFAYLMTVSPDIEYVQFIDGDCELINGWLESAQEFLEQNKNHAIVCGRLQEQHPEKSVYNRLCDMEWNGPVGDIGHCGGIFMIRKDAFQGSGGFNTELISGEEPELCYRLRAEGWKIHRLEKLMALHDSAIMNFSQWWKRMIRGGYGAIDVVHRLKQSGNLKERIPFARQTQSARIWTWGWLAASFFLILSGIMLAGMVGGMIGMAAGIGLWLCQCVRTARRPRALGASWPDALLYGVLTMVAKWPQIIGHRHYFHNVKNKAKSENIEYK